MTDPETDRWLRLRGPAEMLAELRLAAVARRTGVEEARGELESALSQYCLRQWRMPALTARQPEETADALRRALEHGPGHPSYELLAGQVPRMRSGLGAAEVLELACAYMESGAWRDAVGRPADRILIGGCFPRLVAFSRLHLELSHGETDDEVIAGYITEHHPEHCLWSLPELVGEAHRALAAYPTEELMAEAFEHAVPLASASSASWAEWLDHLADVLTRHMKEEHC